MPITTPPTAPSRADPTTFPARADAWVAWQESSLVPQINALEANVNAKEASTVAAAATAQAAITSINTALNRYTFSTSTTMSDPGVGIVRFNNATLASVTAIAMDAQSADAGNPNIIGLLANFGASDSAIKGLIRFTQAGTPSTFAAFNITAVVNNTGWVQLTVTHVASAGSFTNGASFVMEFHRTGDSGDAQVLRDDLASTAAGKGAELVSFEWGKIPAAIKNADWGIRTAGTGVNVLRYILPAEWAAIFAGSSNYDATAAVNSAISDANDVYVPNGVYSIDPDIGIILKDGTKLVGAGLMRTIFKAAPKGGSISDLQAYTKGSVIKRQFNPSGPNNYVTGCYLSDFAVHLNHPSYNASNYRQIGVDLRNITRSTVERVHSGTLGIPGQTVCPTPSAVDACQGYGFAIGTRSGGDVSYCGGEVNTLRDCYAWGAFKNIAIDDTTLTPMSGAHATVVDNCDVQGGHELITQGSQYTAGVCIQNVTIQSNYRQTGNANPTIGVSVSGYNCKVHIKYAEMGSACDTLFRFASTSKNCAGEITYYSFTGASAGSIDDEGSKNQLSYPAAVSGASSGEMIEIYNKAFRKVLCKFRWNGSAIEIKDGSVGVSSVTRNATGDYTVNLSRNMPTADWSFSVLMDADASGHGGLIGVAGGSQSTGAARFYTYSQNGQDTTQIDPRWVYFAGSQN